MIFWNWEFEKKRNTFLKNFVSENENLKELRLILRLNEVQNELISTNNAPFENRVDVLNYQDLLKPFSRKLKEEKVDYLHNQIRRSRGNAGAKDSYNKEAMFKRRRVTDHWERSM